MLKKINYIIILTITLTLFSSLSILNAEDLYDFEKAFMKASEQAENAVVTISVVHILRNQLNIPEIDPFFNDFMQFYFRGMPQQREFKQQGLGSGFIINEQGFILTNDHVVGDADEIEVTLPDGRHFAATFIGSVPKNDIALIKIQGDNLPFVKLGNSDEVKPGQWSIALGNPFGNIVNNPKPTITAGIISAIHRTINIREDDRFYGDLIQTDAAINQGNSGGPLLNLKGEVIGINTLIFSPSGGNIGIGFAIPINQGKAIINDLMNGKEIKHAWLGVWLQDINKDIVQQFGLPLEKRGAIIFRIEVDSPAEEGKLQSGDIILKVDNENIQNSNDVSRIIALKKPNDSINCLVFRKGKEIPITVKLGEREDTLKQRKTTNNNIENRQKSEWRGMTVDNITDEIAKKLDLPLKEGVIVTGVRFASQAHNARIQPGDIIYSIAQKPIDNVDDFIKISRLYDKGDILIHTSRGYVVLFDEK